MSTPVIYRYAPQLEPRLRALLAERGLALVEAPYAFFRAQSPDCSITFYHSGKLVIQGSQSDSWAQILSPGEVQGRAGELRFATALEKLAGVETNAWMGTDESGKGDYFGPLVTCAARVERGQLDLLAELGVDDCKLLSDRQVTEMARGLKALCPHALVIINPERYNTLREEMGANLNRLLAWAHARAIEELLVQEPDTSLVIVDRFGPDRRMVEALLPRGRAITLMQRPRAEEDPAVAVASILARHAFLVRLGQLSKEYSLALPKGAGPPVIQAARQFAARHGREALAKVAKVHFRTTETALGKSS